MFRVAITYCLVLATAAGPWLCCCASSRMVDVRHLFSSFVGPAGGEYRGCCGHTHGPCRNLPTDRDTPGPSAPGECPCKVYAPTYAVLPPKPIESVDLTSGQLLADIGFINVCHPPYCLPPSASNVGLRNRDSSHHSGNPRDILAVLQTLRC